MLPHIQEPGSRPRNEERNIAQCRVNRSITGYKDEAGKMVLESAIITGMEIAFPKPVTDLPSNPYGASIDQATKLGQRDRDSCGHPFRS